MGEDQANFCLPEFITLTYKSDYFILTDFEYGSECFFFNLN